MPTSTSSPSVSMAWRVMRQLGRVVVILLASVLVTWATIAVASSPAGDSLTAAMAPAVAKPGGAPRPLAPPSTGQAEPGAAARPAGPGGVPGGRNVPSPQRGLPDLLKYGGIMAGATLAAVLILRARRPRPRRRQVSA
jgi:hypothetical protein